MKDEYDFGGAARGRFFRPGANVRLPGNTVDERNKMSNSRIPVLWFDAPGDGPDRLAIELHPFAAKKELGIKASLGFRVRSAGTPIGSLAGALMVDGGGGFVLDRADVEEFHRQLGAWLEETKERT